MASYQCSKAKSKDRVTHRSSRTLSGSDDVEAQCDQGLVPAPGFRAAFKPPYAAASSIQSKVSVDTGDPSDCAAKMTIASRPAIVPQDSGLIRPQPTAQTIIRAKRLVGAPGNRYEREADQVAARVVDQIHAAVSEGGAAAKPGVDTSIQSAQGGGVPLAPNIRRPMEQALGADFSRVTVHANQQADQLNQSLGSRAFAAGHDVFFRQGEYNPHSRAGQELLAHELTHVIQQNDLVQRKVQIGPPGAAVSYTDADAVRDAAFEQAGATAQSIENLAVQAEADSVHSYKSWDEALAATEETPLSEPAPPVRTAFVPSKKKFEIETRTRLGFEIEPGASLKVDAASVDLAKELVNETLAETTYLEFVIDDPQLNGLLQVEFRTKPLTTAKLKKLPDVAKKIRKSIREFPLFALTQGTAVAERALTAGGWTVTDDFRRLVPHVQKSRQALLPARLAQHVTHSIPLAGFAKLTSTERNFLIPGSGEANSVPKLILFFFGLQLRTLDKKTNTIVVTTTGRNRGGFNVKTAIDTLIGLLPPDKAKQVLRDISGRVPAQVQIEKQTPKPIRNQEPEAIEDLPEGGFPRFNTGFISAEEKLKPALFDDLRNDVRVLVEHRTDALVEAVNKATLGDGTALAPYLKLFARLDEVKGDDTFQHWFR
jgi:hypothetical protein